jgi:hypothetical protein
MDKSPRPAKSAPLTNADRQAIYRQRRRATATAGAALVSELKAVGKRRVILALPPQSAEPSEYLKLLTEQVKEMQVK